MAHSVDDLKSSIIQRYIFSNFANHCHDQFSMKSGPFYLYR